MKYGPSTLIGTSINQRLMTNMGMLLANMTATTIAAGNLIPTCTGIRGG